MGGIVAGLGCRGGGSRGGDSLVLRGAVPAIFRFAGLHDGIGEGLVPGSHTGG